MRSIEEIKRFAATNGMDTEIRDRGTSYRAGGDIICFPTGFDWRNGEFAVSVARRFGFEGTGYDGRGRHYDLWMLTPPNDGETAWTVVSEGGYANAKPEDRMVIGNESEGRSGCNGIYIAKKGADDFGDLEEVFSAIKL